VPVIIVLALATLLALSACADSGLDERITSTVDEASGTQLRMSDLTDFAWEKLYVFPPYTSQKRIDRALGFEWSDPSGISVKDTITLLVFVDDGEVVSYVAPLRAEADFADLSEGSPWTPETARFHVVGVRVVVQGDGAP
jgi:hypothetical protein